MILIVLNITSRGFELFSHKASLSVLGLLDPT